MDMNDILTLAKAGFNATQIAALMQTQTPVAPIAPIAPIAPVPPVTPPQTAYATDPILAEIQKLTGAMQANAILNSNLPQNVQNTESILAAIINPPTPPVK